MLGLFTELRRSITRMWGRTEQVLGEVYGNEALEYEGEADASKVDDEEAAEGHKPGRRHGHGQAQEPDSPGGDGVSDQDDDGTAGAPAR